MGVVRDVTIDQLTQAVQGISTSGMSDTTGQAINTTLGTLGKDTTLQSIVTALQTLAGTISPSATNVTFDNTGTGLTASNVQSAITEVKNKVGAGTFKISEYYTATTSAYGSINLSSILGKTVNDCSIFNVVATSSTSYPNGLITFVIVVGSNYWVVVKDTSLNSVNNAQVALYVNYYSI